MGRKPKKRVVTLRGSQLLARGDVIRIMDDEGPIKCRVLSCLAKDDGSCAASLEILEGDRTGQRIQTVLRPAEQVPEGGGAGEIS